MVSGVIVAIIVVLIFIASICLFCIRTDLDREEEGSLTNKDFAIDVDVQPFSHTPLKGADRAKGSVIKEDGFTIFNYSELQTATQNFDVANELGVGGFGRVYKGKLIDGKEIAVKKLSEKSKQGREEFQNEVKLEAKLQHKNLLHILGCCVQESERLLVYEYLPNNSLDKWLFDPVPSKQLNWTMRCKIILGTAHGLVYLHEDSRERIVHRDINPSNILLDEDMNPKIADFGFARRFAKDKSHVSTNKVVGTLGHIAPEYYAEGRLTVKADVYSFGVLLLEIVCGRKNLTDPNTETLLKRVWRSFEGKSSEDVIDTKIVEKDEKEEAVRCIQVGLLCTQPEEFRPVMSEVESWLKNPAMNNLPDPKKPQLY